MQKIISQIKAMLYVSGKKDTLLKGLLCMIQPPVFPSLTSSFDLFLFLII